MVLNLAGVQEVLEDMRRLLLKRIVGWFALLVTDLDDSHTVEKARFGCISR